MASKIWTSRLPASSESGRVAWDRLSAERPGSKIVELWFASQMDDGAWCARYEDGHCSDVDVLATAQQVNHARSLKRFFEAGQLAARNNELEEWRFLWILPTTSPEYVEQFDLGAATELATKIKDVGFTLRTSNPNKLAEFQRFGLAVRAEAGADLREVAGTPEEVIVYKALAAGPCVLVEDTSLDVEGFDAGVNVRWLLDTVTAQLQAAETPVEPKALWRVMLAFHHDGAMYVARAEVAGRLVAHPRGTGFSFDPYFVPNGHTLTLGEMESAGTKDLVSARKAAVTKLLEGRCKCIRVDDIPAWQGEYQSTGV
jgi:inosine/xanthosine triphosphate pyrophosphatase family protein